MKVQSRPVMKMMYCLEKFVPVNCPRCGQQFYRRGQDFIVNKILGPYFVEKLLSPEYEEVLQMVSDSIFCAKCKTFIPRRTREVVFVGHYTQAIDKVHEGFVNFQLVPMLFDTKPYYEVYSDGKKITEEEF